MDNMHRLEAIVARWPEAVRVDVAARDDEPTCRARGRGAVTATRRARG